MQRNFSMLATASLCLKSLCSLQNAREGGMRICQQASEQLVPCKNLRLEMQGEDRRCILLNCQQRIRRNAVWAKQTWSQFSMLHTQYKACSLRPSQQASNIAQTTAKADSTHFDASALALWALYKLVGRVGTLSAQGSPQACSATQVTWHYACANTFSAFVLHSCTCIQKMLIVAISFTFVRANTSHC